MLHNLHNLEYILFYLQFLDDLDVVFLVVFGLLAFLVAISTLYDICLRKMSFMHSSDPDYYHKSLISCEFNVFKYDLTLILSCFICSFEQDIDFIFISSKSPSFIQ